jgi:MFS family permease
MYDFMVYGYYASSIAKTYFPGNDPFASLMLALSVFGAGFLMRPVGLIVLGAYIDHHGRRKGLILTLLLMAIGTLCSDSVQLRLALRTHIRSTSGSRIAHVGHTK